MAISSCEEAQRLLDIFGISNIYLTKLQVELSVDEVVSVHLTITPTKEQYDKLCEVIADINKPTFATRKLEVNPANHLIRKNGKSSMSPYVDLYARGLGEMIPLMPDLYESSIDTPTVVPHEM